MITSRVLAVVAAMLLVGAVAVATLAPPEMTLGQGWAAMDHAGLRAAENFVKAHMSEWLWAHPVTALISRPIWLIPAALGLICAGGATTAASRGNATASRRKRS
jgi:hypothetical protein